MREAKDGFEVNAEYLGRRLFSKPEPAAPKASQAAERSGGAECGA